MQLGYLLGWLLLIIGMHNQKRLFFGLIKFDKLTV